MTFRETRLPARVATSAPEVQEFEALCLSMLNRKDGQRWQEAQVALNRIMSYYGLKLKTEKMLQRGLDNLDDLTKHVELKASQSPRIDALPGDEKPVPERGAYFTGEFGKKREPEDQEHEHPYPRLDYPDQDDEHWKCSLSQRLENGKIVFAKRPFRRI